MKTETTEVFLLERNWAPALAVVGVLLAVAIGMVWVGPWLSPYAWMVAAVSAVGVGSVATGVYAARSPAKRAKRVTVSASLGGLVVGDRMSLDHSTLKAAYVRENKGAAPSLHILTRDDKHVELRVQDTDEGNRLVRALGLETPDAVVRFGVVHPLTFAARLAVGLAWFGLIFAAWQASHPFLVLMLAFLGSSFWSDIFLRRHLDVGADGVVIHSRFRSRFIQYRELSSVEDARRGCLLVLRSGERVALQIPDEIQCAGAKERIRSAITGRAAGGAGTPELALLDRNERPALQWLQALRALGDEKNQYREAAVTKDRIWEVIEDPAAQERLRAAAAMAVSGTLDDDGRKRLRIAAQSSASPRLRVAFETALDAEDDERQAGALEKVGVD